MQAVPLLRYSIEGHLPWSGLPGRTPGGTVRGPSTDGGGNDSHVFDSIHGALTMVKALLQGLW